MADCRFPGSGVGKAQGLFLETCCVAPSVLPLQNFGQDPNELQEVWGTGREVEAFFKRLLFLAEQRHQPQSFGSMTGCETFPSCRGGGEVVT